MLMKKVKSDLGNAYRDSYDKSSKLDPNVEVIVRPLTHALAVYYACVKRLDQDRELDFGRLLELFSSIKYSGYVPVIWALVMLPDGTVVPINGRRSSNLFAMCPELIQPGMTVITIVHRADSLQEALDFWAKYDKPSVGMDNPTVYCAEAHDKIELKRLAKSKLTTCVTVLGMARFGTHFKSLKPEQRKCVIEPNLEFLKFVDRLVAPRGKGLVQDRLITRATLPVIHRGWEIDKQACWEFWTGVRDNSPTVKTPLLRSLRFYLERVRTGAANQNNGYTKPNPNTILANGGYVTALCAQVWNMWRSGDGDTENLPDTTTVMDRPGDEGTRDESERAILIEMI